MAQLRRDSELYEEQGLKRLGVAVQKRRRMEAYLARHPMPFPLLADEDRSVARAWGVYVTINLDSFRIARPATFLMDAAGVIRFVHVGRHQYDRPRPGDVLRAARNLPRND